MMPLLLLSPRFLTLSQVKKPAPAGYGAGLYVPRSATLPCYAMNSTARSYQPTIVLCDARDWHSEWGCRIVMTGLALVRLS